MYKMSASDLRVRQDAGAVSISSGQINADMSRVGFVTFLGAGPTTINVANTNITANSTILLQDYSADATATSFRPSPNAGVGFSIIANAAATAPTQVRYFIAAY